MKGSFVSGNAISLFRNALKEIENDYKKSQKPDPQRLSVLNSSAREIFKTLQGIDPAKAHEFDLYMNSLRDGIAKGYSALQWRAESRNKLNNVILLSRTGSTNVSQAIDEYNAEEQVAEADIAELRELCREGANKAFSYRWLCSIELVKNLPLIQAAWR